MIQTQPFKLSEPRIFAHCKLLKASGNVLRGRNPKVDMQGLGGPARSRACTHPIAELHTVRDGAMKAEWIG